MSIPCVAVRTACDSASTVSSSEQLLKRLGAPLLEEFARIELLGQGENPQIDLLGDEQFQHFVGPALPGLVAVEHENDPVGKTF